MRPADTAAPCGSTVSDRAAAKAIITRHGRSPLDYFKLWPDKSYFFSPSGRSVIAYRTAWTVAISLGDPVGPGDELEGLVQSFARFCAKRGWRAAFHQASPELLASYTRHGFRVLKIGEEAMVDLERFATQTSRQRCFHRPTHRLQTKGYRVTRRPPPQRGSLLDEAEEVSRDWLSLPGRRERGFTLGRFDRRYLRRTPLVLATDERGRIVAFVNETPGVRPGVTTVDLMRHRRDAPNGIMDYLFSELMLCLREDGYRWFSLGLTPLAGVGGGPATGLAERVVHEIYEHARVFSFKGLRAYKAKFEPVWEERFLVYQGGALGLARTAWALARLTRS